MWCWSCGQTRYPNHRFLFLKQTKSRVKCMSWVHNIDVGMRRSPNADTRAEFIPYNYTWGVRPSSFSAVRPDAYANSFSPDADA